MNLTKKLSPQKPLMLLALIIIAAVSCPTFLTPSNILSILLAVCIYGVMACGTIFPLLNGGIDLSIGSVAALSGSVMVLVTIASGYSTGGTILGIVLGLLAGTACGALNGLISYYFALPAFVVTLAMKNIILIGMMGCGKTTKGRAAAEALKLPFYDIDEIIQRSSGMTIPEIFKEYGEAHFRKMEQKALFSLENQPCGIVSTGGGIVCQGENIQFMRRTGDIIWIFRDIEETVADIDAADRPLLSGGAGRLREIFAQRRQLYEDAGELFSGSAEDLARLISLKLRR